MRPDYATHIERDEQGQAVRMYFSPVASETVAAESQACRRPSCERSVLPQKRHRGLAKVYCSDECRRAHWEAQHPRQGVQRPLDFTPPPAPEPDAWDKRVSPADQKRLRRMSRLILARLEQGPASNRELAQMFPPGAAWRTRLSDVRFHLRGGNRDCEPIPHHDCGGGLVWYWLREP